MTNMLFFLEGAGAGGGNFSLMMVYLVFLFGFMYFTVIRPQRKRQKAIQQLQSSVSVGDSVTTTGGIYGKVVDIVNDIVILELGTNKSVRVPFQKNAIMGVEEPNLTISKEEKEVAQPKKENKKEEKVEEKEETQE